MYNYSFQFMFFSTLEFYLTKYFLLKQFVYIVMFIH